MDREAVLMNHSTLQPASCPTAHQQTSNPIVDRQLQVNRKRETIGVKVVASQAWGVKPFQIQK